jgi:hypothetical protein
MTADRVKTVAIVTIVSALVWLFAEARTLRVESLTATVAIQPGARALAYRVLDPDWTGVVELELAGPAGNIDALREAANESGFLLELGDELSAEPGSRVINLADALRRDRAFADLGVVIRRVTPERTEIETDELVELTIPVELDLEGIETVGDTAVDPAEITIALPASIASSMDAARPPIATVRIDPARLAEIAPGRPVEIRQVPIRSLGLPEDAWGIRFDEPRTVTVTLQLPRRTASHTIPEMPVYLSITPTDLTNWVVEIPPEDRVLTDVTLTGPAAVIAQIRRGDLPLTASVTLTTEDLALGITSAPVSLIGRPSGVVADIAGRTVAVTVTRRQAAPSPE